MYSTAGQEEKGGRKEGSRKEGRKEGRRERGRKKRWEGGGGKEKRRKRGRDKGGRRREVEGRRNQLAETKKAELLEHSLPSLFLSPFPNPHLTLTYALPRDVVL